MTTATQSNPRWQEITTIWKDNRWLYVLAGLLLGVLLVPFIEQVTGNLNQLIGNLVPEAIGITFTVLILDRLAANRAVEERKLALFRQVKSRSNDAAIEALDQIQHEGWFDEMLKHHTEYYKDEHEEYDLLILSNVQWAGANLKGLALEDIAFDHANLSRADLSAASIILCDMTYTNLQDANLSKVYIDDTDFTFAQLQRANLFEADLSGAFLDNTNLEDANLFQANIQGTYLGGAILQNANLKQADLRSTYMLTANLQEAILEQTNFARANLGLANFREAVCTYTNFAHPKLTNADLRGTSLWNANLLYADLENAKFDEKTVLPDSQFLLDEKNEMQPDEEGKRPLFKNYWTPETDMTRYTDPNHPDFWEPEWVILQREQGQAD